MACALGRIRRPLDVMGANDEHFVRPINALTPNIINNINLAMQKRQWKRSMEHLSRLIYAPT